MSQYRFARAAWTVPVTIGTTVAALLVPAVNAVAATAPTPASLTDCAGKVAGDHAGTAQDEPYLLDYAFSCDGAISAYTVIVEQQGDQGASVDDFGPSPSVFESDGVTPSSTETATCEGTTPSSGINCNFGAGGSLPQGDVVRGSIDPVAPYCPHVTAPAVVKRARKVKATKRKAGRSTRSRRADVTLTPVPRAVVALVVTDATGAQDGPFALGPVRPCGRTPVVVPSTSTGSTKRARS